MSAETSMAVPGTLRWAISDVTVARAGGRGAPGPLVHLPDADTSLIFRRSAADRDDWLVAGPRTRASYHAGKDFPLCLRVRLRPGAARLLLGVPVHELVDRVIDLGELWDGPGMPQAGPGDGPELVLRQLEETFLARLTTRSARDLERGELVRTAAVVMRDRSRQLREPVPVLARRLAVSERHLRDLFSDGVGLPPKRFERIERVRRVLAHGPAGTARWAQLASASGFYDQSHMTAEFRALMGVTPAAFFAGRLPALQPC